ncbi:unnamed protein product [Sympodiomycopsis kandeliae]
MASASTTPADPLRPTFFELIASSQLNSLLSPAARFTLSVLAQRNPRIFLKFFNRFEELWAVIMFFIERHYLLTWGSSFAENFYSLKRAKKRGLNSGKLPPGARSLKLSTVQVNTSLFCLVAVPYIKSKVHDWWERNGGGLPAGVDRDLFDDQQEQQQQQQSEQQDRNGLRFTGDFQDTNTGPLRNRSKHLLSVLKTTTLHSYPYATSFWQLWILSYNIRYLFNHTTYWRPYHSLLKMEVRRVGPRDYPSNIPLLPPNLPNPLRSPIDFALKMLRSSPYIFFESLKYLLPISLFAFKFAEWWYSTGNTNTSQEGKGKESISFNPPNILSPSSKGVLHNPPSSYKPPTLTVQNNPQAKKKSLVHNTCPLCGSIPIQNPAVVVTSGYSACYTCLNGYVEKYQRCPVTMNRIVDGVLGIRRVLA